MARTVNSWIEVSPSDEIKREAGTLLSMHSLRAADALQLAAAIVWANYRPDTHPFVTFDENLRVLAKREGFCPLP